MTKRTVTSMVRWVACGALLAGCTPIPSGSDSTRQPNEDGGFANSGGFFTEGAGSGIIVPFEPEAEDEVATDSFFAVRSIDRFSEDSAGPKFVDWGDINGDGLPDLVTVWNQSQVVQLQLQQRDADGNVSFRSVQIDGNTPIAIMAGVHLSDMDGDGQLDIILLVKHNATLAICPGSGAEQEDAFVGEVVILFSPTGGDVTIGGAWQQVRLTATRLGGNQTRDQLPPGADLSEDELAAFLDSIDDNFPGIPFGDGRAIDLPEGGGMTSLAVGDMTGDGLDDILITSNVPEPPCHNGRNQVELFPNPGAALARTGDAWGQVIIGQDAPFAKDIVLVDMEGDGDLDVIVTRVNAASQNVRWLENPGGPPDCPPLDLTPMGCWERRTIGQIDGGADVMEVADIDGDGFEDILVRSNAGSVIQWFRHPSPTDLLNNTNVLNGIPWAVYTIIELAGRQPRGLGVGDINFDGQLEVLIAAEGSVFWLDSSTADSVFDEWSPNLIVDDAQLDSSLFAPEGPAFINDLLVFDIDCDGTNDVIATIDRRSLSGLSTDVVVWFRNILLPEDVGLDIELVPGCPERP